MNAIDMTLNVPSLNTVKDCREIINYYVKIKLSVINIPALESDLSTLANYLKQTDQNANDVLVKVANVLDTYDIQAALEDLSELCGDPLKAYQGDLYTSLNNKKNTLNALCNELSKSTQLMKTMSYTSNTYRRKELEDTRANLQAISKVEKDEFFYDVLLQKKQALDTAIEAYNAESFYDKALPIINQIDNVVAASESPATFKKKLIKEGVEAAKTILKLADNALKYDNMVSARIELIKKINQIEGRADEIDKQLKSNFEALSQILAFDQLRNPKADYLTEVEKIIESYRTFIAVVFTGSDPSEIARRFVEHAPALRDYANSLYPYWLRV
jgi:hypothetical protein